MRRLLTCLCILTSSVLFAQQYGNEWIDYGKTFYKIKVAQDGIYRIPYSTLVAAIPGIGGVNTNNLVMYHNGRQEPIYISNTTLGANDYIEFYGRKNLGDQDSQLFVNPAEHASIYLSLFTDTSVYFLTTANSGGNARFTPIANNIGNPPAPEPYFWHKVYRSFGDLFYEGKNYVTGSEELSKSTFEGGEGFASNWRNSFDAADIFPFSTPFTYTGGPQTAELRAHIGSRSNSPHTVVLGVGGQSIFTDSYNGSRQNKYVRQFSINLLSATTNVSVDFTDNSVSTAQNRIQVVQLRYPRQYQFSGESTFFWEMEPGNGAKYLELNGFNDQGAAPILYDITNGYRITAASGTTHQFMLPASVVGREIYLRADANYFTVNSMSATSFINYSNPNNQGNYIIISDSSLYAPYFGKNQVEEYRRYRDIDDSPITGEYNAIKVSISQLYDQFAYGINKSPMSIINFIRYATDNFNTANKPKHVFLIGKGREYPDTRSVTSVAARNQCLIPTFGYPGSDILLACQPGKNRPMVSLGRLAAQTPADVANYLTKVTSYEQQQRSYVSNQSIDGKEWMKEVLHFGGGTSVGEQSQLASYLKNWEKIIRDTLYGANVEGFYKNTSNPIQLGLSAYLKGRINKGVSLLTFFGHSSANAGFDISIDEPQNYNNVDRYPVIISNGCLVGLIHAQSSNYSEQFVLPANRGAIAFLATTGLSLSTSLNQYTTLLYNNIGKKMYNRTLGEAVQQNMFDLDQCCASSNFTMMVSYEFTLHGDPAISLNQYGKPDYAIEPSSMYFNPSPINAASDSFEVKLVNTNLGMAKRDSISATIYRRVYTQDNTAQLYTYSKRIVGTLYKDTITFKLPTLIPYNNTFIGYNLNEFGAFIESDEAVDEMAEGNNRIPIGGVITSIQGDDILPIYPYEFAIVPKQNVILKASTINPFAPYRTYRFQIDTTELFNSGVLQNGLVSQVGGVVKWQPNLIYSDSTVYYWRVAVDSAGTGKNWHYSSFLYLKDEYPGWNQSHYYQYKKDAYNTLNLGNDRVFKFSNSLNEILCKTGNYNSDPLQMRWYYNNVLMHAGRFIGCGGYNYGVTFGIIDSASGKALSSYNPGTGNYGPKGNIHCAQGDDYQFGFDFRVQNVPHPDPAQGGKTWPQVIRDFVNSIPDGYYVLVYTNTYSNPQFTTWDTMVVNTLVDKLGAAGFAQLKSGNANAPYIYFTQKGNVNFNSQDRMGNSLSDTISLNASFTGKWYEGNMTSTKIGPAREWGSFHWKSNAVETPNTDSSQVEVYGVKYDDTEVLLFTSTTENNLLNTVDANVYPYLRLKLYAGDQQGRTPTQLYYWRVLYKQVPEAALNPAAHFVFNDTVTLGGTLNCEIALENVTDLPMDSMITKYIMRDASLTNYTYIIKQDSLRGLDTMILKLSKPIAGNSFSGVNRLFIEANPAPSQPEQYHFNNIAELSFTTSGDNLNPLLDVTFDGRHIMNGDIVSSKPTIVATLKDENKFLALNDTALVQVYLKYPGETEPRYVPHDNSVLTFYPASSSNLSKDNTAKVELKPEFVTDGVYELLIKDKDRSGNQSSNDINRFDGNAYYDYKTSFEVVTKATVSNVLNYPNPFTTSTRFVFTLTGNEVPDYMKIQIMTIRGIVVKEITKEELGPLRIGKNLTEYAWDGRDQFGDLLANGVYYYKVITKMDNKEMEHRGESFDKYFKKGFGKMVMIR